MYAIVDIAGQQLKVEKDQKIFVNRLEGEEGSKVSFEKVLLFENDGDIKVGTPVVENCVVSATIVSHLKGDKVLVFKKKRRKGYQKLNGHRQQLTQLLIEGIGEEVKKQPKKAAAKATQEAKENKVEETAETTESAVANEATKEKKVAATEKAPKAEKKTAETKKAAPKKKTAAKAKKEAPEPKKDEKASEEKSEE